MASNSLDMANLPIRDSKKITAIKDLDKLLNASEAWSLLHGQNKLLHLFHSVIYGHNWTNSLTHTECCRVGVGQGMRGLFPKSQTSPDEEPYSGVLWSRQEDWNISRCKSHWDLHNTASIWKRAEIWICCSICQEDINTCWTAVSTNRLWWSGHHLGMWTVPLVHIWKSSRGNRPQATAQSFQ